MKIAKTRDVKSPTRGTPGSAGIDFFVPKDFICQALWPHERIKIPSGIKADIPEGFVLIAFNKSGVSSNTGLDVLACVIDSDYQGEIHLSVVNTSKENVLINPGDKLVQFILIPVRMEDIDEVSEDELFEFETARGSGGFGSTES